MPPEPDASASTYYFVHSYAVVPTDPNHVLGTVRLRRGVRRRGPRRPRRRSPVPPRKIESRGLGATAALAGVGSPARGDSHNHDPVSRNRSPRRPGGASDPGRLRSRDGVQRRSGRPSTRRSPTKARPTCTSSISTGRSKASPCMHPSWPVLPRPSAAPSTTAAGCGHAPRSRPRLRPGSTGSWSEPRCCRTRTCCAGPSTASEIASWSRSMHVTARSRPMGGPSPATRTPSTVAGDLVSTGVRHLLYTDISRDGMLEGPNLQALRRLAAAAPPLGIIASGGVSSIDDLRQLAQLGLGNLARRRRRPGAVRGAVLGGRGAGGPR